VERGQLFERSDLGKYHAAILVKTNYFVKKNNFAFLRRLRTFVTR
jgi:hypothetical protein